MTRPQLQVFPGDEAASRAGADSFVACAELAIAARGRFDVALSGGDTPRAMYRMLAGRSYEGRIDWSRVHLFWGDDRAVPANHPRSNFGMARDALVSHVPIPAANVHRMRGEIDAAEGAVAYEEELRAHFGVGVPIFDLIHLGVGEDGHTASLFPRDSALEEQRRWVLATVDRERDEPRITLTLPVIQAARRLEVLVLEPEKADVVRAILTERRPVKELPAVAIGDARGEIVWLLSRGAAERVPRPEARGGAAMIGKLVMLGGGGDLARRLLLPGLAELWERGCLPSDLEIVGVGRDDTSDEEYREEMSAALAEHAPEVRAAARRAICERLSFGKADATSADDLRRVVSGERPVVAYLALPPAVMEETVRALAGAEMAPGSRIVVEKPVGEDLESARSLNAAIGESFDDDDVFRIDHFLGLRALRELAQRRADDEALDLRLRREHVARVEIAWDETLALEGRAGYYDGTGALRDMVQNHLLQVLALVAMDRPRSAEPCDVREAKIAVLREVERPSGEEAKERVVRGRYGEGTIDGRDVPAYVDEEGVDADGGTETFIALTLAIDSERWRGVPFVVRTGKALAEDRHALRVVFGDGEVFDVPIEDEEPGGDTLTGYGHVLRAVLAGKPSTTVAAEEAEECWRIVEPYMALFEAGLVPLYEYSAGSDGPAEEPTSRLRGGCREARP